MNEKVVTDTCVVCGKTVTQTDDKFWDDGWIPQVMIGDQEKGPVCPDHEIDNTGEYLTLKQG
ncbi:MAG: hypothetical protein Q8P22_08870 [Chloroflexota bacterium]|nr:hypothetical protein [Chloroflexota bacterium]